MFLQDYTICATSPLQLDCGVNSGEALEVCTRRGKDLLQQVPVAAQF